jgi:tetratricopeptide (TPR) repeat protein
MAARVAGRGEKSGKAMASKGSFAADRSGWSFAQLLDWHLTAGTRPKGRPQLPGKQWTNADFAYAVGTDERSVRNWRRGRNVPAVIVGIERELFGENNLFAAWRAELREAYEAARNQRRKGSVDVPLGETATATTAVPLSASNIPIRVPTHFMGRDDALALIEAALRRYEGRVTITALHGLRGIGKTTLAAAYAERHRDRYRVTWWLRAQSEPSLRADLVGLGVRLGWIGADSKEERGLAAVMERLRNEGEGILLIFDNALDANALKPHLPRGGAAHVIVTSNAHAWRGIAEPVEIRLWPREIGADYLIARTGNVDERAEAEALSAALGGLPLAHEQAAAYCERLDVSLGTYRARFEAAPARLLDDPRHAPAEYHDGLTVAKTFNLAIEEAEKLNPAAEPLIVYAALLAPEPLPLFLFAEGRTALGPPLASALASDGLDEVVASLRVFALVDREVVADERNPAVTTDTIRLHRLVREVAAARLEQQARYDAMRALVAAVAAVFPRDVYDEPKTWPRARRLEALALNLVQDPALPAGTEVRVAGLCDLLASYRQRALGTYAQAQPLFERALAIREQACGPMHPDTATSLNNLAFVLELQGKYAQARRLYDCALAIREEQLGSEHPDTAESLHNLARMLHTLCRYAEARPLLDRALAIYEKALGPEHHYTARTLNNLAVLLHDEGELSAARPLFERALAAYERALTPDHPNIAMTLHSLARLTEDQGDPAGARAMFERAVTMFGNVLGPDHPTTNRCRGSLARLMLASGDALEALPLLQTSLANHQERLGPDHSWTRDTAGATADALDALGRVEEAKEIRARFGATTDGGEAT